MTPAMMSHLPRYGRSSSCSGWRRYLRIGHLLESIGLTNAWGANANAYSSRPRSDFCRRHQQQLEEAAVLE